MPVFNYRTTDSSGSLVKGTIATNSPQEAREQLRDKGLQVLELEVRSTSGSSNQAFSGLFNRNRFTQEVASSVSDLGTLLSVGVPLLESLDTLILQFEGKFRNVLVHLRDDVSAGLSLAEAMQNQPRVFDSIGISMVEVGENTGNLDGVLTQLGEFKSRSLEFKNRVLSAMLYPMIVFGVAIMVMVFLMVFVVPMLLDNLVDAGKELPWPTQVLKYGSEILVAHWWWMGIMVGLGIISLIAYTRTKKGNRVLAKFMLRIPIIGDLGRKQEISRVSMVIATLTGSGVDFLRALEIASRTTKNQILRETLMDCHRRIKSGRDIGDAMGDQQFLPPMVGQIFTVGQKSGRLEEMLLRLAEDYDRQVRTAANRLQSVLEPILIVGLAVFVGFILFATLLPIMEAGNVLSE